MNKPYVMFLLTLLCWFAACSSQNKVIPTDIPIDDNVTPIVKIEMVPNSTLTPIATPTQTKPVISLSKIHEWMGGYPYNAVWFAKSNQFIILMDKALEVYDASLNLIWSVPVDISQIDSAIAVSPDDKFIILYDHWQDGVILLDSLTGKRLEKSGRNDCVIQVFTENMFFINNNEFILGFDGETDKANWPIEIRSWKLSPLGCNKRRIIIPLQHGDPELIIYMKASPNGKYFIANFGKTYKVWDSQSFKLVCEISGWYATFRPLDGKLAVINNQGDTVSYFDVESCSVSKSFNVPNFSKHQQMEFTKDGKYLIFIRQGFQIFNADTGKLVFEDTSRISNLVAGKLQISPDGKYLLSSYSVHGPVTALWKLDYTQSP